MLLLWETVSSPSDSRRRFRSGWQYPSPSALIRTCQSPRLMPVPHLDWMSCRGETVGTCERGTPFWIVSYGGCLKMLQIITAKSYELIAPSPRRLPSHWSTPPNRLDADALENAVFTSVKYRSSTPKELLRPSDPSDCSDSVEAAATSRQANWL
eukprot:scaffold4235_cov114-Isochrysis_galbana.AAC.1